VDGGQDIAGLSLGTPKGLAGVDRTDLDWMEFLLRWSVGRREPYQRLLSRLRLRRSYTRAIDAFLAGRPAEHVEALLETAAGTPALPGLFAETP
jgi:hypothetical protein